LIIVDRALREREAAGEPVRMGMVGAGFQGRGLANTTINSVPGMTLAAVSNRNIEGARRAYGEAGVEDVVVVETVVQLEDAIQRGVPAVTEDWSLLCRAENIDCLVDVTGAVEFGARMVLEAIENGKHVILMNAELDGTVGPLLKVKADRAGVVLSGCDGDQPGVEMNLYRFVTGLGVTPLVMGNIKGLQDRYRNPTTQEGFARKWGQNPYMVTSFADGTKVSFEQALVANATGMRVPKRGMFGWDHAGHIDELTARYDIDELRAWGGIVDYVVGAHPSPGIYCLGTHDDPRQQHYLKLYKLGDGPLYSFYAPYHLCHFEVPTSVARAVLFHDAAIAPLGGPRVEVVATAKVDLHTGNEIDAMGGYLTYGEAENADAARRLDLLPMGVAEGCRLVRDVPRDQALTYADVAVPEGRLIDKLRLEQTEYFFGNETSQPRYQAAHSAG
jgi:predicted homoserine dehydrogenase-like protein